MKSDVDLRRKVALGASLADLGRSRGVSQAAAAEEVGIDQSVISRAETATREVSLGEAMHWAEALGIESCEFASRLAAIWDAHLKTTNTWDRPDRSGDTGA